MEIGIEILSHGVPIDLTRRQAKQAEEAGATSLWVGEYHHHGYVIATAVAQSTNHIQIGPVRPSLFPDHLLSRPLPVEISPRSVAAGSPLA